MADDLRSILGVRFFPGTPDALMHRLTGGGLFVVPSAPVMVHLADDPAHREAMEQADVAVTDSGFMVLLWLAFTGERLVRISGLRLLKQVVQSKAYAQAGATYWVMPSSAAAAANVAWLQAQGYAVTIADTYVAPHYARSGALEDPELVRQLADRRPGLVVVALGGNVQERLGWYLRRQFGYRPAILCIGGAIAFLSGEQAAIPAWADRLALGWLFRFAAEPRSFAAKVREVWRLPGLIRQFGPRSVGGS